MSQAIAMSQRESQKLPGVIVLKVKGSIDSDTAPLFEKELSNLLAQGKYRVVVDLGEVEYVSSAGVGIFVGMLQNFRDHKKGDMKACSVSKKIMKVFESIGLDEMMDFLEDLSALATWTAEEQVKESLDHFDIPQPAETLYSGEAFTLRVEARDVHHNPLADYLGRPSVSVSTGQVFPAELVQFHDGVWVGQIAITAAGPVTLSVQDGPHQGSVEVQLQERPNKAQFPITVACHTCSAEIGVKASDIYRCEECDETFYVDEWAHVFTLKPGSLATRRKSRYKGMELKINADVNYLSVIRQVISGLCSKEGMDDVTTNSVALAIEEVLLNLIEHGNDFDPWQIFRLRMDFQKKQLKIQIRDYGDAFDVTQEKSISIKSKIAKGSKRGVGSFLVNQLMDQIKYESQDTYNQLTMIKRYGSETEEK